MWTKNAQSKGGKSTSSIVKEKYLSAYLKSPNTCLFCSSLILPNGRDKVSSIKRKKFCNRSCAAKYNNSNRLLKKKYCLNCGIEIKKSGSFCRACWNTRMYEISLAELKLNRDCYTSWRNYIRKSARELFIKSGAKLICHVCGYSNVVEIQHIKSVSDFPDDAIISDINSPGNLVALCPNHHWEIHHGLLEYNINEKK